MGNFSAGCSITWSAQSSPHHASGLNLWQIPHPLTSSQPTPMRRRAPHCPPGDFLHFPSHPRFFKRCAIGSSPRHASLLAYEPPAPLATVEWHRSAAEPAQRPVARQHRNQRFRTRRPIGPATAARKINNSPRRARLPLCCTRLIPATAWRVSSMGAGHCPAAGRARSPRSS